MNRQKLEDVLGSGSGAVRPFTGAEYLESLRDGREVSMAMNPMPWVGDAVLPNAQSGSAYRVFAGDAYARIKEIVEKIVASSLIYLPSAPSSAAATSFMNTTMPATTRTSASTRCSTPKAPALMTP